MKPPCWVEIAIKMLYLAVGAVYRSEHFHKHPEFLVLGHRPTEVGCPEVAYITPRPREHLYVPIADAAAPRWRPHGIVELDGGLERQTDPLLVHDRNFKMDIQIGGIHFLVEF